jgi:hypothetical protein
VLPLSHQDSVCHMRPYDRGLVARPGNAHGEHALETQCGGQAEDIIASARDVKTDETGRSCPIGVACQSTWRTARLAVPPV